MHLVDKEDRVRARGQRVDDRLEALFEVSPEPGAGEQRRGVQREHLCPAEPRRHVIVKEPTGQPFGQRRLPHTGVANEDGIVLAPTAENLEGALQLIVTTDQRVQLALAGAVGEAERKRRERVARCRPAFAAGPRLGPLASLARTVGGRHLGDAMRDVVQDIQSRNALRLQQLGRKRVGLLQSRRQHVAEPDFVFPGALDVQDGVLQDALERQRLVRLPAPRRAGELLEGTEKLVQRVTQRGEVATAGRQNLFAVGVVRQGIQQVLERQMSMTPSRSLAVGDVQDELECGAEHGVRVTPLRGSPEAGIRLAGPGPGSWRLWSRRRRSCRPRRCRALRYGPAS